MIPNLTPQPWMAGALCTQVDAELFFPELGASHRPAKSVCLRCDVRKECLEYALENRIPHGVWGGKASRERRNLGRAS